MTDMLERIAYAIARGFARAWFEVHLQAQQALREVPDAESQAVLARFRDLVARLPEKRGGAGPDQAP